MTRKGLLLVLADPPPSLEEEFNDWYDTEHLPERATLPGFETALRFAAVSGGPAYAALYDLSSVEVLESAAYRAVSGDRFSPWTRRVTSRAHPVRMVAQRLEADDDTTERCSRLLLLKVEGATEREAPELAAGIEASFVSSAGYLRSRIFAGVEPRTDYLLAIAEFSGFDVPRLRLDAFGGCAKKIALAGLYRPYRG